MKLKTINQALLASAACAIFLAGCATNEQGQLVIDPNRVNAVIVGALTPPPPAAVVVEPVYQPLPTDVYVANVVDRDVVIVGGDTYIWAVGPDGIRHRQFYAHGDRRADVLHRREELHHVMASHDGHLPMHPFGGEHSGGGHPQPGRPDGPGPAPMMTGHGQPPHADMHAAGPARPAPAPQRPASKDPKKS
ncbi:hypothetical protein [Paraburkholderia antibiotica]|uniref:hypothetical protein n=1 Tax=Paraburkholderia antibiotica TaxID=2728839 RepID=UPI001E2DA9F9|nr:hypothetical protein [Paraburkholderia antibiotica]